MDLKRSTNFFDVKYYNNIKLLLYNIALEYQNTIAYYQGMNYIAIFIYETFMDDRKAFEFFCYIAEKILIQHFSDTFGGLVRLIWTCDRMIQVHSPLLWEKLRNGGVSSIHFSVPNLITLFTSLVKSPSSKRHIAEVWDLMLSEDGLFSVLKTLIYILEIQRVHIDQIDTELLLIAMKNVESDPFAIIRQVESDESVVEKFVSHLSKENLRQISYDPKVYTKLQHFYTDVVSHIQKFWG